MLIRFIDSGALDASLNMAIDEAISIYVRKGKSLPTVRFYGWIKPSVTIGEFQKITEVNTEICRQLNIPVVRRPTGGKGILHYDDLTYSFVSKKEGIFRGSLFQTYEKLSHIFSNAFHLSNIDVEIKKTRDSINRSSLCFARSSYGEISFKGVKIMGSAQKRWTDGFLQQGTIPVTVNKELLKEIFFCMPEEAEKIYGIKEFNDKFDINSFKKNFKITLNMFDFQILEEPLSQEEFALAQQLLLEKYQRLA